ncbi:MAG: cache domain-containing protein, partial [Ktedonobacteraceae bacterium]|nr:cache domain-containing protein [Ktedonobacteraceae bacterium]
ATPIKNLLAGDINSRDAANDVLFTAQHRDIANYINISLLNARGGVTLSYPTAPLAHGKDLIVPEALQKLRTSGEVVISDVFYDRVANAASVDLYARVTNNNYQIIGYVRVSLGLHRVWEPVDSEPQANGPDSYAFILDQNGVRIAYTNTDHSGFRQPPYLFKAIAPIPADAQQRIKNENLYGNSTSPVTTNPDQQLADKLQAPPTTFEIEPAGTTQPYTVAWHKSSVLPWTYYILKPSSTVTGLADQQLLLIIVLATLILILAVGAGLLTGRRIALPILRSVASLRRSSQSMKALADEEHVVATEQSWMVEASQVALESVKYYTNATGVAARRIHSIGTELTRNSRDFDAIRFNRALQEMVESASYIERAIKHQETMNEKLATALRVTTQATDQLTRGAKSTDEAAVQMEQIVGQLTAVVGE